MKKEPFFNIIVDNEPKRSLGLLESSLLDEAAEQAVRLKRSERRAFYKGIVCGAIGLFCLCLPVGVFLNKPTPQPFCPAEPVQSTPAPEIISEKQAQTLKKACSFRRGLRAKKHTIHLFLNSPQSSSQII